MAGFISRNLQRFLSAPMSWEPPDGPGAAPGISLWNLEAAKKTLPLENKSHSQHSGLFPFILLPPDRGFGSWTRLCKRG